MKAAVNIKPDDGPVQHDLVRRALDGKFLVGSHEVNDATRQHLRQLAGQGKVAFVNGGWTKP